jgi:hypothetical protein
MEFKALLHDPAQPEPILVHIQQNGQGYYGSGMRLAPDSFGRRSVSFFVLDDQDQEYDLAGQLCSGAWPGQPIGRGTVQDPSGASYHWVAYSYP